MSKIRKFVIANWKSSKTFGETKTSLETLEKFLETQNLDSQLFLGVALSPVALVLATNFQNSFFKICSQDVSEFEAGPHTGTTTVDQLQEFGVDFVLIGHSERRSFESETDERVVAKVAKALEANLTPIFCFGESKEDRESGDYIEFLTSQLQILLDKIGIQNVKRVIFAYEPIWAIGSGLTASIGDISEIANLTAHFFSNQKITFIYGGSVNKQNASSILSLDRVDGLLVGSASLKIEDFSPIILEAHNLSQLENLYHLSEIA